MKDNLEKFCDSFEQQNENTISEQKLIKNEHSNSCTENFWKQNL